MASGCRPCAGGAVADQQPSGLLRGVAVSACCVGPSGVMEPTQLVCKASYVRMTVIVCTLKCLLVVA